MGRIEWERARHKKPGQQADRIRPEKLGVIELGVSQAMACRRFDRPKRKRGVSYA